MRVALHHELRPAAQLQKRVDLAAVGVGVELLLRAEKLGADVLEEVERRVQLAVRAEVPCADGGAIDGRHLDEVLDDCDHAAGGVAQKVAVAAELLLVDIHGRAAAVGDDARQLLHGLGQDDGVVAALPAVALGDAGAAAALLDHRADLFNGERRVLLRLLRAVLRDGRRLRVGIGHGAPPQLLAVRRRGSGGGVTTARRRGSGGISGAQSSFGAMVGNAPRSTPRLCQATTSLLATLS